MYTCSWLIDSIQCTNRTDYLVCDSCYPEKDRLYHAYKEAEKTVISAISSAPRGDLLEVSKVLGRLTRVIELRKSFTSRLCHQVRDNGHKYHISQLLQVLLDYKQYLFDMMHKEKIREEEEIDDTPTAEVITQYTATITQQITTVIEEDPFAEFDDAIRQYKEDQLFVDNYIRNMCDRYSISRVQCELVIQFLAEIHWYVYESPKLITHIVNGRGLIKTFIPGRVLNKSLVSNLPLTNLGQDAIDWIISFGNRCKFALIGYQKRMILFIYSKDNVYPNIYELQITVSKTFEGYNVTILETMTVDIDVVLSVIRHGQFIAHRQKLLK